MDDDRLEAACENIHELSRELWPAPWSAHSAQVLMEIYAEATRAISLAEDAGLIVVERDHGVITVVRVPA